MDLAQGKLMNPVPKVAVSQSSNNSISRPSLLPQLGSNQKMTSVSISRNSQSKALPTALDAPISQQTFGALIPEKYQRLISSLPTRNDWKFMPLHEYQGFWYFSLYLAALLTAQDTFQAQPSDIFLCTFPKTGTTWIKALAFAILTRRRFSLSTSTPLLSSTPHDCVPFLEIDAYAKENNRDPDVPLIATDIPYTSLPASVFQSGCKMVYLCRDPKDVLISTWHFLRSRLPQGIDKDAYVNMDDSFQSFCEGAANNGPYWDHVLGYWNASLEHPDKVLFLVYEDMKKNTVSTARKLAEFMGCPFTSEEEEQGLVQQIVDFCSFENLKKLEISQSGAYSKNSPFIMQNNSFYRKGKSGDWKNYFTEEMGARLDQIVEQKMSGSGFSFLKSQLG